MRKKWIYFIVWIVSSNAFALDMVLFNTEALRKRADFSLTLLTDETENSKAISPVIIETDLSNRRIVGATLYYPLHLIDFETARNAINKNYAENEYEKLKSHDFGAWRIKSKAFTITLSKESHNNEDHYIVLIYAIWIGTENMTFE